MLLVALAAVPAVAIGSDGDVDTGFGTNGRVTVDLGGDDVGRAAIVQPDGKLVVAGSRGGEFGVARLNPDGSPDGSFTGDGQATVDFGATDVATGVALLPDGRIVVAGYTNVGAAGSDANDFAVAVLKPDGTPDTTFSGDGRQTVEFGDDDRAAAVAVDSAGRIVVGGSHETASGSKFALARLAATGTLDSTFGTAGKREVAFPAAAHLGGLAVTAGDGVVAVGRTASGSGPGDMAAARLDGRGIPDASFGNLGTVVVDFGGDDGASAVVARPNGSFVLAGTSNVTDPDFALLGLQADGAPDPTFSGDGKETLSFGPLSGGADSASSIALTSTGRIAVAGRSDAGTNPDQFAIALLEPDGSPSTGFSGNGKRTVDFAGADDEAYAVAARGNRIYAAGSSGPAAGRKFAVVALEGGGPRVSVRDAQVAETAGVASVPLTLSAASSAPVTVRVTTASGTALSDRDFTPVDTVVTFDPGTTSLTLPVELIDDKAIEPLESFKVLIGSPTEAGLGRALANVRIASDEVDSRRPVVSSLKVRPKAFAASRGARVRWRLSEPSSVLLLFQRASAVRTAAQGFEPLVGRRVTGRPGANELKVGKRIAGRRLLPGLYRVQVRATDAAGNDSRRVRATFRVKR
ncbi:MAG: hypothetical protein QOG63_556 [Thermoleophilaceae bacterium]|nr:hypothetical protein [Thermoleophilaceae bacterium]